MLSYFIKLAVLFLHGACVISLRQELAETRNSGYMKELADTTAPTPSPIVLSDAPTYSPARGMPTPQPVHNFGTMMPVMPTGSPSEQPQDRAKSKRDKSGQENYDILISVSVVGGIIVIVCAAILFYWHFYTRVSAPSYSKASDSGGISFSTLFSKS